MPDDGKYRKRHQKHAVDTARKEHAEQKAKRRAKVVLQTTDPRKEREALQKVRP